MKDELGGGILKKLVELRAKLYSSLKENKYEKKKATGTKKCLKKRNLNLEIIKTV